MTPAGLLRRWLDSWRSVPVDLRSPLPPEVARARLREGTSSRWSPGAFDGGRRVIGRVRDDGTVRLQAGSPMIRNSWRPAAHGVLEADGTGSRLLGVVRVPLVVLGFSAFWLAIAGAFFVIGFAATVVALLTGHVSDAGGPAAVMGGGAGFIVVGGGLIGVGLAAGRRGGAFLIEWLRERLQIEA